jgi:cholesterol oxidase
MDGSVGGERFYVADDGFPNLLLNAVTARIGAGAGGPFARLLRNRLERGLDEKNPTDQIMVWLGEGVDGADGRLRLGRSLVPPFRRQLELDWDLTRSRGVIEALLATFRRLSEVEGGRLREPVLWRLFKSLVTVHPLGGCAMAGGPEEGVVDHRGQVFGYPNLFVADGALLPRPTGRNPSMTIGALAERTADLMTRD